MIREESDEADDKILCPHCKAPFSSVATRNRHVRGNVCGKGGSMAQARSIRKPRPPDPPSVLLRQDLEGLLVGHSCFYSKYNCFSKAFNVYNIQY